jgi:hypothetical protein
MTTNLTGTTIAATYDQLLHIDGGPTATPKTVYSGTGTATAMKLGTINVEFENIRIDDNTISSINTNGNINFTPNGTGSVVMSKVTFSDQPQARTALGLGTMATQNSGAVAITGGTIQDVVFTGSFTGITLIESDKFSTKDSGDGVSIEGNNLFAEGTSTNIDVDIYAKGTGEVNITNVDILSGKVPFNTMTNRAYAQFLSTVDQTATVNTPTAVTFNTSASFNAGVTLASSSQITFTVAGVYDVYFNLQLINAENAAHEITLWLRLNGTDVVNSASRIIVPQSSDGGTGFFAFNTQIEVTAGQYVQVYWATEDADVSLSAEAAEPTTPFARPAIPSSFVTVNRIG